MKRNEGDRRNENEWKWKKWIDNEIGPEGAKTLSEALKINTSLTSLTLYCDENETKWKKREEMKSNKNEKEMNR